MTSSCPARKMGLLGPALARLHSAALSGKIGSGGPPGGVSQEWNTTLCPQQEKTRLVGASIFEMNRARGPGIFCRFVRYRSGGAFLRPRVALRWFLVVVRPLGLIKCLPVRVRRSASSGRHSIFKRPPAAAPGRRTSQPQDLGAELPRAVEGPTIRWLSVPSCDGSSCRLLTSKSCGGLSTQKLSHRPGRLLRGPRPR